MQNTSKKWAFLGVGVWLILWAAPGCTYSCDEILACEPVVGTGGASGTGGAGGAGGSEPDICPDDPADGPVAPECGVWVSASLGDDGNPGTQTEPVRTLAKAIEHAQLGTGRVYACGETYVGPFELPSGISLSGGFTCESRGWVYAGQEKPAILISAIPDTHTLTLLPGESTAMLTDLEIEAADAQKPGGSSVAVFSLGTFATIRRAHFIAGNGADGADGAPGDHNDAPAQKGFPGNDGEDACTNDIGLGGASVELECEAGGEISTGGEGGDGSDAGANDGLAGLQPPDPNDLGYGAGGKGETDVQACTGGISGAQGIAGLHGFGAIGEGQLTAAGYVGAPGGDGSAGEPGQGGGGGGGSIGSAICGAKQGGGGGGSGGTGGCGGKAGKGGQAGGSSIGVAAVAGILRVQDVRVTTGTGGKGGNGGAGQQGGKGGLPGKGGIGFGGAGGVKSACGGGIGGNGGNGGNGGGGRGGHSLALAFSGDGFIEELVPVDVALGAEGLGGNGGNPAIAASMGKSGIRSQKTPLLP